jgi:hypothetical protein
MGSKTKNAEASEAEVHAELQEDEIKTDGPADVEEIVEDAEEAKDDSEVDTEPEALAEPSEEPIAEAEPELEDETDVVVDIIDEAGSEDDSELSENIDNVANLLVEVRELLTVLKTQEAKASDTQEVEDLRAQLAEARENAEAAENQILGIKRALSLAKEGLTTYASLDEKAGRYGAMENTTWLSYVEDLRTIKKSVQPDEKPKKAEAVKDEEDVPLILESVGEVDPVVNYRAYVMAIKKNKNF